MSYSGLKCTVCLGSAKVRETVNRGLVDGISMRDLADKTGISKSSIHRHKQDCLKYELQPIDAPIQRSTEALTPEIVEEGFRPPAIPVETPSSLVVRNRKLGEMPGLTEYAYGKIDNYDRMARKAEEAGNLRAAGDLDLKGENTAFRIGALHGIKEAAPLTHDNRSITNVFQGMPLEEVRAIVKALSTPKPEEAA